MLDVKFNILKFPEENINDARILENTYFSHN